MGKTIIMVHGRHYKPDPRSLFDEWFRAIELGLARDHASAVASFHAARVELVYFGDISNAFLKKIPDQKEAYDPVRDVKDRKACLAELAKYKKTDYNEKTYRKLPGANWWKEGLADVFAGPLAFFGLSERAINSVAPDMAEYWDEATDFGSRVRAPMIRPLIEAFDRGDEVCVIAHSLGSLIAYDTFWKFSHTGEYRGAIDPNVNYSDKQVKLWITIGSPLADETVKAKIKGATSGGQRRYPTNIQQWVNITAEDDFVSHDQKVANDYQEMKTKHVTAAGHESYRKTKIKDIRMYNLAVRGIEFKNETSNPHHASGYLISPQFAAVLARWLEE